MKFLIFKYVKLFLQKKLKKAQQNQVNFVLSQIFLTLESKDI